MSSVTVANIVESCFKKVFNTSLQIDKIPLSDGGDGALEVILYNPPPFTSFRRRTGRKGKIYKAKVKGPLETPVIAKYGILDDGTAIIELAKASGIALVPRELRNPLYTTTYGTGELIRKAVAKRVNLPAGKAKKIILFVGGSTTCDGGIGILSALGVKFLDKRGKEIKNPVGKSLIKIHKIDTSGLIRLPELIVACDVFNPLVGKNGSARIYGPQKGAGRKDIELLEKGLIHFSELTSIKNRNIPGAGSGGGVPFGLMLIGAKITMGAKLIMQMSNFEKRAKNADLIITGEGEINKSTKYGKVVWEVMQFGKAHNIPVIGITAKIGKGIDDFYKQGLTSIITLTQEPVPLKTSIDNAHVFLKDTSLRLASSILARI